MVAAATYATTVPVIGCDASHKTSAAKGKAARWIAGAINDTLRGRWINSQGCRSDRKGSSCQFGGVVTWCVSSKTADAISISTHILTSDTAKITRHCIIDGSGSDIDATTVPVIGCDASHKTSAAKGKATGWITGAIDDTL